MVSEVDRDQFETAIRQRVCAVFPAAQQRGCGCMGAGNGIYATSHFTACTGCGQLCRIEVVMPVVTLSDKRMVKFCPMCGTEWHYTAPYANSRGFRLVAHHVFGREPSDEEVQIVESIYPEWDATVFPEFKQFLRELIKQAQA